jgi:hypothetical protein
MTRRARLDLLVALGLLLAGGGGLAWQVGTVQTATVAPADGSVSSLPLMCPLGPHIPP